MYTEQWIREEAGTAVYNQGRQLYLNGRIQNMSVEDVFGDLFVEATLIGDMYASSYSTHFVYDSMEKDVVEYSCSCADFPDSDGPCKHCVALLLKYLEYYNHYDNYPTENTNKVPVETISLKSILASFFMHTDYCDIFHRIAQHHF